MSDLTPFERSGIEPAPAESSSEVFRPELRDFDWDNYASRQQQINELLRSNDAPGLGSLLEQLHIENPDNGVMLNNLHGTTIEGQPLKGLHASMAVLTRSLVRVDLPALNFRGGVGSEATFSGQNLAGANFVNSVLPKSSFAGANLEGADFTHAFLNEADFTGANLTGADFTGSYLVNVSGLSEEQVRVMKLDAARTILQAPTGTTSLEVLLLSRFGEAKSIEDILKLLDPVPVAINPELGQPIGRLQAKRLLRGLYAERANWTQADFTSADLRGATINGLVANQVSFRAATVTGMIVRRAVMREADMVSMWAPGIIFEDADLKEANFTKANLVGAVLRGVDLRGAQGLNDKDTNIEGLAIAEDCLLPQGYGYDGIGLQMSQKLTRELET